MQKVAWALEFTIVSLRSDPLPAPACAGFLQALLRISELPAELDEVHAMLGDLARAEKNHRHIVGIELAQCWVGVKIYEMRSGKR